MSAGRNPTPHNLGAEAQTPCDSIVQPRPRALGAVREAPDEQKTVAPKDPGSAPE